MGVSHGNDALSETNILLSITRGLLGDNSTDRGQRKRDGGEGVHCAVQWFGIESRRQTNEASVWVCGIIYRQPGTKQTNKQTNERMRKKICVYGGQSEEAGRTVGERRRRREEKGEEGGMRDNTKEI